MAVAVVALLLALLAVAMSCNLYEHVVFVHEAFAKVASHPVLITQARRGPVRLHRRLLVEEVELESRFIRGGVACAVARPVEFWVVEQRVEHDRRPHAHALYVQGHVGRPPAQVEDVVGGPALWCVWHVACGVWCAVCGVCGVVDVGGVEERLGRRGRPRQATRGGAENKRVAVTS